MNNKTNSINFVEFFPNTFKITYIRSSHIEADMSGYSAFRRGRFNEHIFHNPKPLLKSAIFLCVPSDEKVYSYRNKQIPEKVQGFDS